MNTYHNEQGPGIITFVVAALVAIIFAAGIIGAIFVHQDESIEKIGEFIYQIRAGV